MDKSHDELRAAMKRRLSGLLELHGAAAELSRKAGIPKTTVYTWLRDKKKAVPDAVDAFFLARALGTTVEYLVTGEEPHYLGIIDWEFYEIAHKWRAFIFDLEYLSKNNPGLADSWYVQFSLFVNAERKRADVGNASRSG
jgi:transcriptional regulator with XRE-family HTH domain